MTARLAELRVLIVTDQYEPMVGGVPTVTRELARGLAERGHAVEVLAPSATGRSSTGTGAGAELRRLTVARARSVRWPWYEDQRLGLLSPVAAARADRRLRAGRGAHPLAADARRGGRARPPGGGASRSSTPTTTCPPTFTRPPTGPTGPGRRRAAGALFDVGFYGYLTGFANRCDRVTAPTATALLLLRDHGLRAPSQVVSNGVDLERLLARPGRRVAAGAGTRCPPAGR